MAALGTLGVFLTALASVTANTTATRYVHCGFQRSMQFGQTISFQSPYYPHEYPRPLECIWTFVAPVNARLQVTCPNLFIMPSQNCHLDEFWIFPSANINKADGRYYCGKNYIDVIIDNNIFSAAFFTEELVYYTYYTGFSCNVTAISKKSNTKCGVKGASRVVGGQDTAENEWPWQAGIRRSLDGTFFCGAVLIDAQLLLTAAHCAEPFSVNEIFVSLGDHKMSIESNTKFTQHIAVAKKIVHENYNSVTVDNDIALLQLTRPVIYNAGIKPICLPCKFTSYKMNGEKGTVSGWGTTTYGGRPSEVLQEVELPILTTKECQQYLNDTVTDNMICTYRKGYDACKGDSGGPLSWLKDDLYHLVGVVSFGDECAKENSPGVYTKVTNYLKWIEGKTSVNFCPS
ncbi:trypsin II-P29-like [Homarus americanus]|uniref:trypsin II-P29-like n=1 Tax=Homarus americanus TaxID=6706 RepID=UPI001C462EA9|nr:trypsin II-P29-like [Homarus americanus]